MGVGVGRGGGRGPHCAHAGHEPLDIESVGERGVHQAPVGEHAGESELVRAQNHL